MQKYLNYKVPNAVYMPVERFNYLLKKAYGQSRMVYHKTGLYDIATGEFDTWNGKSLFEIGEISAWLTFKDNGKLRCYAVDLLRGRIRPSRGNGCRAYAMLKKFAHIPEIVTADDMDEDGKVVKPFSAHPLLWVKPGLKCQWLPKVYEYDQNSSYAWGMLQDMPDTEHPLGAGWVKPGMIAFNDEGELLGDGWALYRFPAIESPFKKFVEHFYQRKASAPSLDIYQSAKDNLNMAIGFLQRKNPFLRAAILGHVAKRLWDLKDKNTLFINSDAIFSTKARFDIPLGKDCGEFKLAIKGLPMAFKGYNYQVQGQPPVYRGIPKAWFPGDFDITKSPLPGCGNKYEVKLSKGCPKIAKRRIVKLTDIFKED